MADEAPKGALRAKVPNLKLAQTVRRLWVYYPAHGEPLDAILKDPGYWAHIANQMTIGDRIELCPEDESYWAEVRVVSLGNVWAKVQLIAKIEEAVDHVDLPVSPQHSIEWKGPKQRFAVVRSTDKQILKGEFQTKGAAAAWLADHLKALAA